MLILGLFLGFHALSIFLHFFVPSVEQILEVNEKLDMKLLKGPRFVNPKESRQVPEAVVLFMDMETNLGPVWVYSVIRIILLKLFEWRHLWIQISWNFEKQGHALIQVEFLDLVMAVEDPLQLVVLNVCNQVG